MTLSDLNPDALAELEAKLARDLDMVRRVRALLLEHQASPTITTTAPPPPVSTPAPPPPAPSPVAFQDIDEILSKALHTMPEAGFFIEDLKRACKKIDRLFVPDSDTVRAFLKRGVRKGRVVVADIRSGRRGSLYKHTLPPSAPSENPPDPPLTPAE